MISGAHMIPMKPAELAELVRLAAEDDHGVLCPTHLVVKDGAIVGYLSLDATPIVNVWLHSKKVRAVDSVALLRRLDEEMQARGKPEYVMPCCEISPFYPHMDRLGFNRLGAAVFHQRRKG